MSKILATDLDGTLFYPYTIRTAIPKKNIKFLRKWIDDGNKVVLVTSRSSLFCEDLLKEVGRECDYITYTGANMVSDGKQIREVNIPNQRLIEVLKLIEKEYHPMAFFLSTEKYQCVIRTNRPIGKFLMGFYNIWYFFQFKRREKNAFVDNKVFKKELKEGKIFKVMVFFGLGGSKKKFTKELNKVVREKYPEMEFSWSKKVIEITPLGCNKGDSLEYYCQATNVKKEDVIVVGDSGNDISMFTKFHDNSFCMRKAYTSVRKYAAHTVSRVYKLDTELKGEKK